MSGPIRKIVVGVDGSAQAGAALDWAAHMARGMGSEVIAVYAIDIPIYAYGAEAGAAIPPQFDPEWRTEMKREFEERWCRPLKEAEVKYRTTVEDGKAAAVIASVAEREDADIIVVGRRGRGGFTELLLGSVSHALVLHTWRPVLVISGRHSRPGA